MRYAYIVVEDCSDSMSLFEDYSKEQKMESIKEVLVRRDGMSEEEADGLIEEAKECLECYLDDRDFAAADDICAEFFGLEPDYIMELM
jgi:hypothetical protein